MAKRGALRADFLARLAVSRSGCRRYGTDLKILATWLPDSSAPMLGGRFDRLGFDNDVGGAPAVPWPLNVRELERAIGAASVMIDGRVTLSAFGDRLRGEPGPPAAEAPPIMRAEAPARESREHVSELLRLNRGNISGVAPRVV